MGKMKTTQPQAESQVACASCGSKAPKAMMVAREGKFYCASCAQKM